MALSDLLEARLETIDALKDRVRTAAQLGELVRTGALPSGDVSAFVVPLAMVPRGQPESGSGYFTHQVDETYAVILVVRAAGDATGERGLAKLNPLKLAVIAALSGWVPEDDDLDDIELPIGDFRLVRAQHVSLTAGAQIYQLDFAIPLQLRILA